MKTQLEALRSHLHKDFSFVSFTDSEFNIKDETFEEFQKGWNVSTCPKLFRHKILSIS